MSSILSQTTTSSGTSAYEIGTRTATTVLRLKNGETDVLAGLIDNTESHSGNKIPGIGEMPILGRLFGNTTDNDSKTEIVLSITPHLIRNIQRPDAKDASFAAGTETSMRNRPESGGGASPAVTPNPSPTPTPTPNPANPLSANANANGIFVDRQRHDNGLSSATPITSVNRRSEIAASGGTVAAPGRPNCNGKARARSRSAARWRCNC